MLDEDQGLRAGMWSAVADCDMRYRISGDDAVFVWRGHRDVADVSFTREGLEKFLPLGKKALKELSAKLKADKTLNN
ncbi:MAG: hypothetical protein M3548_18380 [Actinomycetota bacterium]|nr:hypothetical protein [Actinomycetota bacterium]